MTAVGQSFVSTELAHLQRGQRRVTGDMIALEPMGNHSKNRVFRLLLPYTRLFVKKKNIEMVKTCQWAHCNTDTRYPDRLVGGIRFFRFPVDDDKCMRWIRACNRPSHQLNMNRTKRNRCLHISMSPCLHGLGIGYVRLRNEHLYSR